MPIERPSYTCPRCGAISYNPVDIRERYCGRCHRWGFLEDDMTDYSKDAPYKDKLTFDEALVLARSGFLISRQTWRAGMFVTWAKYGAFTDSDNTTGTLEGFAVMHRDNGECVPYIPSNADMNVHDWSAVTRQQQRPTAKPAEIVMRHSNFATNDSDFDKD